MVDAIISLIEGAKAPFLFGLILSAGPQGRRSIRPSYKNKHLCKCVLFEILSLSE